MTTRTRHYIEKPDLDERARAKIVSLYRDHGVERTALVERFGCSYTVVNDVLREAGLVSR